MESCNVVFFAGVAVVPRLEWDIDQAETNHFSSG